VAELREPFPLAGFDLHGSVQVEAGLMRVPQASARKRRTGC
jgi:hypothetical protein